MCNENTNTILDLDFSEVSDENNWLNEITTTVQTVGGKLKINSDSSTATFFRQIGNIDAANNRIKLKCNLEVEKTSATGPSSMEVLFRLVSASNILYQSSVELDNLDDGINVAYLLERDFVYAAPITAPISLQILIPTGFQNTLYLSDLQVLDFNFCQDNVRTYFVIDQLLEDGLVALAGGIQLLEWKVDGYETLTSAFFNDTNVVGGEPLSEWNFAKADIDGDNRVAEVTLPNTFNPFVNEFKLKYDTANSFHGGKPIGTLNGNDYGPGLVELGFDKPAILNGALNEKKGAFFIDINYDVSLKVVFNVIINKKNSNLFSNPTYLRKYTIEWDIKKCEKRFYYVEKGVEVDQYVNGFLTGLTGPRTNETTVGCDQSFNPTGGTGNFSYVIDFGTGIGQAGINYDAFGVPDRFIISWDGNVVADSGFVGNSAFDQQLIDAGVDPAHINTSSPPNGAGILQFAKTSEYPTEATITVLAPLGSTAWNVTGICPDGDVGGPGVLVQVTRGKCDANLDGTTIWTDVYVDNILNIGVGGVLYTDAALTIPFDGDTQQFNYWRIQTSNGLIFNFVYSISSNGVIQTALDCGSGGGTDDEVGVVNINETDCFSCLTFELDIPVGETRQVQFSGNFAPGGSYNSNQCIGSINSLFVVGDGTFNNVTPDVTFVVGIDGAKNVGGLQNTSVITITVRDGATITETFNFTRQHANANC